MDDRGQLLYTALAAALPTDILFAMALDAHVQWYIFVGILLVSIGTLAPQLRRTWLSLPIVQLLAGIVAGPLVLGLVDLRWSRDAGLLEVVSEIAVIISLYAAGIKMRIRLLSRRWIGAVLLASLTMVATTALATAAGILIAGLPFAFALLLAAVLAPTDPVLADEIQVNHPHDRDLLRQSLTGEAGLNDGTAFPLVLLAIGLIDMELHPLGEGLWHWFAVDLLWKIAGGLALGGACGVYLGGFVLHLRTRASHMFGADECLSLGLITLVYGAALAVNTYAFLAVFAAAVGLRRIEMLEVRQSSLQDQAEDVSPPADDSSRRSPTEDLVAAQMDVGSTLERLAQVYLVVVVGVLLTTERLMNVRLWIFAAAMLFVVRPLAVWLTFRRVPVTGLQRALIAWFGVRGIGTVYYLSHAMNSGLLRESGETLSQIAGYCIATITLSILLHGLSAVPLTGYYERVCQAKAANC